MGFSRRWRFRTSYFCTVLDCVLRIAVDNYNTHPTRPLECVSIPPLSPALEKKGGLSFVNLYLVLVLVGFDAVTWVKLFITFIYFLF